MANKASLIDELEQALASGTSDQRIHTLARITDLFLIGAESYTNEQIDVFDDVLLKIAARIESKSLARLSNRLAPLANAPKRTVKELAFNTDIEVARPVLAGSERLDESDLVDNARTQSQEHLLAISERKSLSEAITDVLVERGDREVVRSVAGNTGARFSNAGFRRLVTRSTGDDVLATTVGSRRDIPRAHYLKLIERASASVREKLTALNPQAALAVKTAVAEVTGGIRSETREASVNYADAKAQIDALMRNKQLNEQAIYQFARERRFEQVVISLSVLCDVEVDVVERAMLDPGAEVALILAKYANLSWTTAKAILLLQTAERGLSAQDLDQAMSNFSRLQPETARRVLGFYRTRRKPPPPTEAAE
ncbi:MAG TPA: DUF2336 domain-containing protein [Xanthobacteraceae bacterium]|nr:DUF2336 domain-containing protein [Xanthobacteraceae bacterium]